MNYYLFLLTLCTTMTLVCPHELTDNKSSSYSEDNYEVSLHDLLHNCEEGIDFKTRLYQYAIKELIEKNHEESAKARRNRRQKWLATVIGTITTLVPLAVAIIQATQSNGPDCVIITNP